MSPHDAERFAALVADFVEGCGIDPPFHLVAIGANGAVSVAHHRGGGDVEEVCATMPGDLVAPLTLTVIGADGRGKSAKIEIEAQRPTMM